MRSKPRRWSLALALLAVLLGGLAALAGGDGAARGGDDARGPGPRVRGLAVPMHAPAQDYGPTFAELRRLGARQVALFVHLYQRDTRAMAPRRHPERTPTDAAIAGAIRSARGHGLEVALVPLVLLEAPAPGEWRGKLRPPSWATWFSVYRHYVVDLAGLAQREGATLFAVGSELGSSEGQVGQWRAVIAAVRAVFRGHVTYAANWDRHEHVAVWEALDSVGLSGYFELTSSLDPTREELVTAWRDVRRALSAWRDRRQLSAPILFMEVGYPSIDGCARHPWDYTRRSAPVDLAEQRLCYEAFVEAWRGAPELEGAFFYEWTGEGGPTDRGYTPRGKPALEVLRAFLEGR
ncbi:MAG: hypothetical protein M9894_20285 [Planctomycetes bacterium]|nr:hypothetical protein [Planctomycetota bacterium]